MTFAVLVVIFVVLAVADSPVAHAVAVPFAMIVLVVAVHDVYRKVR